MEEGGGFLLLLLSTNEDYGRHDDNARARYPSTHDNHAAAKQEANGSQAVISNTFLSHPSSPSPLSVGRDWGSSVRGSKWCQCGGDRRHGRKTCP